VKHEREPFGGTQSVEYDEQRDAHRVDEQRLALGVTDVVDNGVELVRVQGVLTSRSPRSKHVQAHPRDHGRQPTAKILYAAGVRAAEPDPALLNCVVRLVDEPSSR